jgi:hypothetical protein
MLEQLEKTAQQVAADAAADTAVAHLDHFLVGGDQQMMVNADRAKLVDDDGDPPAVVSGKNAIQKGGFTGA